MKTLQEKEQANFLGTKRELALTFSQGVSGKFEGVKPLISLNLNPIELPYPIDGRRGPRF